MEHHHAYMGASLAQHEHHGELQASFPLDAATISAAAQNLERVSARLCNAQCPSGVRYGGQPL